MLLILWYYFPLYLVGLHQETTLPRWLILVSACSWRKWMTITKWQKERCLLSSRLLLNPLNPINSPWHLMCGPLRLHCGTLFTYNPTQLYLMEIDVITLWISDHAELLVGGRSTSYLHTAVEEVGKIDLCRCWSSKIAKHIGEAL